MQPSASWRCSKVRGTAADKQIEKVLQEMLKQVTNFTELLDEQWAHPESATGLSCQRCHIRAGAEFKQWLVDLKHEPFNNVVDLQTVRTACQLSVHLTRLTKKLMPTSALEVCLAVVQPKLLAHMCLPRMLWTCLIHSQM